MESVTIDGARYYSSQDVAELWGIKETTVRRYAEPKSGKIPDCIKRGKYWYIPVTAIRPITKPVAQGLLWGIIGVKNDPSSFLDLSGEGIDNSLLDTVLNELHRQNYLLVDFGIDDLHERLVQARITVKGFELVRYRRRFKENSLEEFDPADAISIALSAVQTVMQLAQFFQG